MRRLSVAVLTGVLTLTVAVGGVAAVGGSWKAPPFQAIGINRVEVDSTFREQETPSVLSVFIETGSASPNCLVSLNELWGAQQNVGMVFCAARNPDLGNGPIEGVWVHVFFLDDPGPDMHLLFNVYQEGARFWSQPQFCASAQGC